MLTSLIAANQCLVKDREHGLKKLTNMESELSFCLEHAGRTCCSRDETNKIMSKFAIAKQLSVRYEPQTDEFGEAADPVTTVGLGATCQTQMHKALCATCDGEIVSKLYYLIVVF